MIITSINNLTLKYNHKYCQYQLLKLDRKVQLPMPSNNLYNNKLYKTVQLNSKNH
jgi:hypothetical protein